jgi:transposase
MTKTEYICVMEKVEEILNKILLPINSSWKITDVQINETKEEIYVYLNYDLSYIEVNGRRYSIYDHRPVREWRHLDLWQYKTFITARLPRYMDEHDFYHTVDIPWAEPSEQMTVLLKKNSRNTSINKKSDQNSRHATSGV